MSESFDTESSLVQPPNERLFTHKERRFLLRATSIASMVSIALSLACAEKTLAEREGEHQQTRMSEILAATAPPYSELNEETTELASDILNTDTISLNCDSDAFEESPDALAYVRAYTIDDALYVPPTITMRGYICTDLITFPRMQSPLEKGESEPSSTYEIRAKLFAKAAAILLHEDEHINLEMHEGAATCYAVQKLPGKIEPYFDSYDDALYYSLKAAEELSAELLPEYTDEECFEGGNFDLGISPVYTTDGLVPEATN